MRCLVAVELQVADTIIRNLEKVYPDWVFEICTDAQRLREMKDTIPEVLLLSRFLPGEDPLELIKYVPSLYHRSHIVILAGTLNEQTKAYIRAAAKYGLRNVVTGKLPGDRPYTIFAALTHAREVMLEFDEECSPAEERPSILEPIISLPAKAETITEPSHTKANQPTVPFVVSTVPVVASSEPPVMRVTPNYNHPRLSGARGKLILVCSNKGGVGKTTVSIGLARELANGSVKTLLQDLDLGSPDIANFFDIKGVPGIESLSGKRNAEAYLSGLIVKKGALDILPGVMNSTMPFFTPEDIANIVEITLHRYSAVIVDMPPEFWIKRWLEGLFPRADLVLAVCDQSKLSEMETVDYAPKIVMLGTEPSKIQIVCNRFNPSLHNTRTVEKYFNAGFKSIKNQPRVIGTISEDWEAYVKKGYKGEIAGTDGKVNPWNELGKTVAEILGLPFIGGAPSPKNKRFSLFGRR